MRYHDTRPMKELIKMALGSHPRSKRNFYQLAMKAWYKILPDTKGHIQNGFMKNNCLYLKTSSALLRHELYLQKKKIKKELKETIQSFEGDPELLEDIFFI